MLKKWLKYRRWLKLIFWMFFWCSIAVGYFWPNDSEDKVTDFADRLRGVIVEGRSEDLRSLPCGPANCIDERVVEQLIGDADREGYARRILKRPEIILKVYEPFSLEQLMGGDDYLLFYYDPHTIRFAEQGYLSPNDRRVLWRKSYIETRVSFRDGAWTFIGTPFLSRPRIGIDPDGKQ